MKFHLVLGIITLLNLLVSNSYAYNVELSWDIPVSRVDNSALPHNEIKGYVIRYGSDQANLTNTVTVAAGNRTADITGLPFGTQFWFAIATEASHPGVVYTVGVPTMIGPYSAAITIPKPPAPSNFRIIKFLRDFMDQDNELVAKYFNETQLRTLKNMDAKEIYRILDNDPESEISIAFNDILQQEFKEFNGFYKMENIRQLFLAELYDYGVNSNYFALNISFDKK